MSEASRILSSFMLCSTLVLSSLSLRPRQRLTWCQQLLKATWRPCWTVFRKRPTLRPKWCVPYLPVLLCRAFSRICMLLFFIEGEHFDGANCQEIVSFFLFQHLLCLLSEVERITHLCVCHEVLERRRKHHSLSSHCGG